MGPFVKVLGRVFVSFFFLLVLKANFKTSEAVMKQRASTEPRVPDRGEQASKSPILHYALIHCKQK